MDTRGERQTSEGPPLRRAGIGSAEGLPVSTYDDDAAGDLALDESVDVVEGAMQCALHGHGALV